MQGYRGSRKEFSWSRCTVNNVEFSLIKVAVRHIQYIIAYRLVWTEAARKGEGAPWYTGVLLGAERFMASWHKSEEEASKLREVNRAA